MSAFVSSPAAPHSPEGSTVEADGDFWPAIDVNTLRVSLRLGEVPHERLIAAIEGGILATMDDCAAWRAVQIAAGHATCEAAAGGATLAGEPVTTALFARAVRYHAAAELADAHTDFSATDEGVTRAQDKRTTADDYRRMATGAVRQLLRRGAIDPAATAPAGGVLADLV